MQRSVKCTHNIYPEMALWITNKQTINDNKTINENNNERKSLKEIRNINITTSKYFEEIF